MSRTDCSNARYSSTVSLKYSTTCVSLPRLFAISLIAAVSWLCTMSIEDAARTLSESSFDSLYLFSSSLTRRLCSNVRAIFISSPCTLLSASLNRAITFLIFFGTKAIECLMRLVLS